MTELRLASIFLETKCPYRRQEVCASCLHRKFDYRLNRYKCVVLAMSHICKRIKGIPSERGTTR